MKEIKLKILDEGKPAKLDYKGLIKSIIQIPADPRRGITLEEVKKGVRVLDALEKSNSTLKLEDADYTLLTQKLKTFKFGTVHKNILEFADDIQNAKEVK